LHRHNQDSEQYNGIKCLRLQVKSLIETAGDLYSISLQTKQYGSTPPDEGRLPVERGTSQILAGIGVEWGMEKLARGVQNRQ